MLIFNYRLLPILCVLCFLLFSNARAADQIVEATITVTNFSGIATNGAATLTVNGATRTATNNVAANPAIYFFGTNSMLPAKTNLYNHIATYPFGSAGTRLTLINIGTNSFKLRGQPNQVISVSIAGLWGTALLSTNTITNFTGVAVPLEYYTAAEATNIAYELTRFFAFASNAVAAAATGLSNHLNQFLHQTASNKLFYASTNRSGALESAGRISGSNATLTNGWLQGFGLAGTTNIQGTNVLATNVTLRHFRLIDGRPEGTNAGITNGYTVGLTNINSASSNHINYGDALRSEGSGPNSLQLGSNANATALRAIVVGNNSTNSGQDGVAFGNETTNSATFGSVIGNRSSVSGLGSAAFGSANHVSGAASYAVGQSIKLTNAQQVSIGNATVNSGDNTLTVGAQAQATDYNAAAVGFQSQATRINSLALGPTASAVHSNSTAIGPPDHSGMAVTTTRTNQIVAGTAQQTLYVPGALSAENYSNVTAMVGSTNRFPAGSDISFGRFAIATVANGHNTLNVGTNVYIDLTGSPTAPWTWGGITGGNRDGKLIKVRNSTGWPADILHNSGTEPTAGFRISTPTTTNVTLQAAGWAEFLYDPNASRWQLVDVFNTATPVASATNAVTLGENLGLTNSNAMGIFYQVQGQTNIQFRTIRSGDLVTLTNEGTNITVAAAAAYALTLGSAGSQNPADSSTYYFGSDLNANLNTTWDFTSVDVPKSGTLKRVFIKVRVTGTLGSTEAVSHYVRINDTTDVTVDTTATYNTTVTNVIGNVSQAVTAGDRLALKITTPAWVTNPTAIRIYAVVYIE